MDHTPAKLYIPKEIKNGKKVISLKKPWYVWFRYRNPETGKFDNKSKFNFKVGINKYKTIQGRKACGRMLVLTLNNMLQKDFNPFARTMRLNDKSIDFEVSSKSLTEAINIALEDKKLTWSKNTADNINFLVVKFLEFAKQHKFSDLPANNIKRAHILEFLKVIKRKETLTSVNNYRGALSTVFTQMVQNNDIDYNFIRDIKKERSNPVKNHPFTNQQIADIKVYLEFNDPYLLTFIRVLAYSFLRNREVLRLQIKDVDLKNNLLTDKTKTKALEKIYIIKPLQKVFNELDIENCDQSDFVFTKFLKPGEWDTTLKAKKDFFSRRFKKVKDHLGFGIEYGIYSFRHSFALNIYENFITEGMPEAEAMAKMLPITRHDSVDGLRNYLREKKKMLPKDYSHKITIDF